MESESSIQFSDPRSLNPAEVNSTQLAEKRRELAKTLRTEHPGKWAIISSGHQSIKSAGVVRRRLQGQDYWAGFEMTSRKAEEGDGFCIHARFVGEGVVATDAVTTTEDEADA